MIKNLLKQNKFLIMLLALACVLFLISACSKKNQAPVQQPVSANQAALQPAKPIQKPVSSVVKIAPVQVVNQFDFSTKKDPFKPFMVVKSVAVQSAAEAKKALLNSLPIHSFDVSQFKLIGIVASAKDNQAMVVDPNGKGYVLKVGMTIGKNDGRITSITTNGVDVLEQFRDDNGRVRRENIRITLPRKQ